MTTIDPLRNNSKPWSDSDLELLHDMYPHASNATLARIFGRSYHSIKSTAAKRQLLKSPEYIATHPGRFRQGDTAWNKGMKGLDIGGKGTRFKPGHISHNWKPIGHEMEISGYLYRKIAEGGTQHENYRPVQHIVWEERYGPVPDGRIVAFKDGNNRHFAINNLELITRSENMRRNSHHTNYPPEISQIIQLRGTLNRKIKNRIKQNES
ncbi:HNH endonuclease signature motif containing protein [Halomonas halocynthiae]|uniref:HNH endonuclease signature motif containing protein n=1 Tax=Halomonas halocynthiae TaxID=176290 RepID=UPI000484A534|nr:HNH endonuclease signature motif containing protein [Halomonas halocynthiae]